MKFRKGWQSQNLAKFLLYKFSFVTEPAYTADDIGGDFFCTLFETHKTGPDLDLLPKNSFWIQIKTEARSPKIDLTSIKPLLQNLEMPFFIGIIPRSNLKSNLKLTIYSGHYVTPFFSYIKPESIKHLKAQPCEKSTITGLHDDYFKETSPGTYLLFFPKITEITADITDVSLKPRVNVIRESCSLMLGNIAARVSAEFTFKAHDGSSLLLLAGIGSFSSFETNFFNRLHEVFFTLHHAYSVPRNRPTARKRFDLYEKVYHELTSFYGEDDPRLFVVERTYRGAKTAIENADRADRAESRTDA